MNQFAYIKYFQSLVKKFDSIATFIENFQIFYFWNSLRPFICAQLDEKNHDLDNW